MLVVVTLALILVVTAQLNGKGDDPYDALEVYADYMPGSPVPADLHCFPRWVYPGTVGEMCPIEAAPYCLYGHVVSRAGSIVYTRLFNCRLPVAYLIAQYGRYEYIGVLHRTAILVWDDMAAEARQVGFFTTMDKVVSVSWWRARPSPPDTHQ
jgi:hypothetical protein